MIEGDTRNMGRVSGCKHQIGRCPVCSSKARAHMSEIEKVTARQWSVEQCLGCGGILSVKALRPHSGCGTCDGSGLIRESSTSMEEGVRELCPECYPEG